MISNFQFTGPHNAALNAWIDTDGAFYDPVLITAAGGIPVLGSVREVIWVAGDGGPVTVTAVPQIAPGTTIGQELYIFGTSDDAMVILHNGDGLTLNGTVSLVNHASIYLVWTGLTWNEVLRNDV
jgi:hypothetical protein